MTLPNRVAGGSMSVHDQGRRSAFRDARLWWDEYLADAWMRSQGLSVADRVLVRREIERAEREFCKAFPEAADKQAAQ